MSTATAAAQAPSKPPWDRPRARTALWLLLVAGAVAALAAPEFLPFYDYPEWLLQGQIVHDLWTGATSDGVPVAQSYTLLPVPVPNLAAPVGVALLALALPIEVAGRVFLVLGVLGFSFGYAFVVRRLQGRATVLEFTGLLWAFGYFLQRGYVGYLFALPIAFVGIGLISPVLRQPARRGRLAVLAALQVLAFLAHLVAWGVLAVAVGCYAVALYRRARRGEAVWLAATAAPTVALLAWYTAASRDAGHLAPYGSIRDKALSLVEVGQFFLRLDPYPGVVPVFPAQLLVTAALLGVIGWNVRRRRVLAALRTPPAAVALLLLAMAVLNPVGNLNSLTKPDQRLLFPAILLLLAALPWRPIRPRAGAAVGALVLATLALHGVAWVSLDAPLQRAADALRSTVPPNATVATVAIPADGGCGAGLGPSIGIPALKWFDVLRMLPLHQVRAELQETSMVALRFDPDTGPRLATFSTSAAAAADTIRTSAPNAYVEVFACTADAAFVSRALAPLYQPVAVGDGYAVLRRVA
jgi:hypothetical protein